jgi:hypothetical protein
MNEAEDQTSLFSASASSKGTDGPIECLGKTFKNDAARRTHFAEKLRKKLQDPEFRKIEGFPIGEDEDILNLSDPPYYTACPNPWIAGFIEQWESEKPDKPEGYEYHREPFSADVSEGKNDPIYSAHSYHTKVPHKAIMRYILHYTDPGDIVFDGFCGTGMTGVAAQMCGDREAVMSLGYQIKSDGSILLQEVDGDGKTEWLPFSKLGTRRTILNDLSPIATFIAHNYNHSFNVGDFETAAKEILQKLEDEMGWMYQTRDDNGNECLIDFVVWSEKFSCPECGSEIDFFVEAMDAATKEIRSQFPCHHCGSIMTKRKLDRIFETTIDQVTGKPRKHIKYRPREIHYRCGGKKASKKPDRNDLQILKDVLSEELPEGIPTNEFPIQTMYHGSRIAPKGFTHSHHFYFRRPLKALSFLWNHAKSHKDPRISQALLFLVEQAVTSMNVQNRYGPKKYSQSNGMLPLVYYIPSQISEVSPWYVLAGKLKRLIKVFQNLQQGTKTSLLASGDTTFLDIPDNSLDYVFTDPPFGANIFYADLNLITESWHRVFTNSLNEAVVDSFKGKGLGEYHSLMCNSFKRYHAALKPGRWITVEFSNSSAAVWNTI